MDKKIIVQLLICIFLLNSVNGSRVLNPSKPSYVEKDSLSPKTESPTDFCQMVIAQKNDCWNNANSAPEGPTREFAKLTCNMHSINPYVLACDAVDGGGVPEGQEWFIRIWLEHNDYKGDFEDWSRRIDDLKTGISEGRPVEQLPYYNEYKEAIDSEYGIDNSRYWICPRYGKAKPFYLSQGLDPNQYLIYNLDVYNTIDHNKLNEYWPNYPKPYRERLAGEGMIVAGRDLDGDYYNDEDDNCPANANGRTPNEKEGMEKGDQVPWGTCMYLATGSSAIESIQINTNCVDDASCGDPARWKCSIYQSDYDLDHVGDVCDNSPNNYNPGQTANYANPSSYFSNDFIFYDISFWNRAVVFTDTLLKAEDVNSEEIIFGSILDDTTRCTCNNIEQKYCQPDSPPSDPSPQPGGGGCAIISFAASNRADIGTSLFLAFLLLIIFYRKRSASAYIIKKGA